jgi:hypothetical protein
LYGGTSYEWSIGADGKAKFNYINAVTGKIGGCTIKNDRITAGNWTLYKSGLATFSNITASGGSIGGFTITGSSISGGGITLNKNGSASFTKSVTLPSSVTFGDSALSVQKISWSVPRWTPNAANTGRGTGYIVDVSRKTYNFMMADGTTQSIEVLIGAQESSFSLNGTYFSGSFVAANPKQTDK